MLYGCDFSIKQQQPQQLQQVNNNQAKRNSSFNSIAHFQWVVQESHPDSLGLGGVQTPTPQEFHPTGVDFERYDVDCQA